MAAFNDGYGEICAFIDGLLSQSYGDDHVPILYQKIMILVNKSKQYVVECFDQKPPIEAVRRVNADFTVDENVDFRRINVLETNYRIADYPLNGFISQVIYRVHYLRDYESAIRELSSAQQEVESKLNDLKQERRDNVTVVLSKELHGCSFTPFRHNGDGQ